MPIGGSQQHSVRNTKETPEGQMIGTGFPRLESDEGNLNVQQIVSDIEPTGEDLAMTSLI